MKALAASDLDRFAKLLALLGSDIAGERAAAAAKATKFLSDRKLDWHDLAKMIGQPVTVRYYTAPPPPPRPSSALHATKAQACLDSAVEWEPHEAKFLGEMIWRTREPTEKQGKWLDYLFAVAKAGGRENLRNRRAA